MDDSGVGVLGAIFGAFMFLYILVILAITVIMVASLWKVFVKAGLPGWGAIIPIYNIYLLMMVARRPGWWVILCFIPIANIIVEIIAYIDVAKNFGKTGGFAAGLILLPFIFFPILGFGNAKYIPASS